MKAKVVRDHERRFEAERRANPLPVQCAEPGCPNRTRYGGRCPEHTRGGGWAKTSTGYGSQWPKVRARRLAAEPTCRRCGSSQGLEVDHIVNRGAGGPDTFENAQTLCHRCHVTKTAQESGSGRKRKRR